jgi:hypothetical protein
LDRWNTSSCFAERDHVSGHFVAGANGDAQIVRPLELPQGKVINTYMVVAARSRR